MNVSFLFLLLWLNAYNDPEALVLALHYDDQTLLNALAGTRENNGIFNIFL